MRDNRAPFAVALLALFLSACSGCATSATPSNVTVHVEPPQAAPAPERPGQEAIAAPDQCGDLFGYVTKWAQALRLNDWKITAGCVSLPAANNAWAISHVEVLTREITIAIDPTAPDHELAVLHELLHAFLSQVRAADSELVEEQGVRTISELAICREKKGDQ
jgi:hypothetical protein